MQRYGAWLKLADRYRWSKPLLDLLRSMTPRERDARLAWIEENDGPNNPSRSDWYLMEVAAEVRRSYVKHPESVAIADLKLSPEKPVKPLTRKEAAARAKARWAKRLGRKDK